MNKKCIVCDKSFIRNYTEAYKNWNKRKFCTRSCYWKAKIGTKQTQEHKDKISAKLKGVPKSEEHRQKVIDAITGKPKLNQRGTKHWAWKGDEVGYDALHDWVSRYGGKEKKCANCGQKDKERVYHWANISGKYKRELSDWKRLCVPCHSEMDKHRKSMAKLFDSTRNRLIK